MALLTVKQVCEYVKLSRQEIHRRRRLGTFPAPIKTGAWRIAWLADEVDSWITKRVAERDALIASREGIG